MLLRSLDCVKLPSTPLARGTGISIADVFDLITLQGKV